MKIGILGHFARNTNLCDGQTVKTRNLEQALLTRNADVATVDSYQWKKHAFSFLFRIIKLIRKSDAIIIMPDVGGIKVYPYLVNIFAGKRRKKIYNVVGAWLPSFLEKNKRIKKQLKKFDCLLVETQTMQKKLAEQGVNNVEILPNFKELSIIEPTKLMYTEKAPFKFCIFSRVMKEKGINDAAWACDKLNNEFGESICLLDIYGPIQEEYKEEFFVLCEQYSSTVAYKGVVSPNDSVEILKEYYMLLFPTLFYTEGVPGTIIDAFSAGVPVLASEWESYRDVLSQSNSITYAFGDREALYKKLKYCVENSHIINGYKKQCLNAAEEFLSDGVSDKLWNLLCKVYENNL